MAVGAMAMSIALFGFVVGGTDITTEELGLQKIPFAVEETCTDKCPGVNGIIEKVQDSVEQAGIYLNCSKVTGQAVESAVFDGLSTMCDSRDTLKCMMDNAGDCFGEAEINQEALNQILVAQECLCDSCKDVRHGLAIFAGMAAAKNFGEEFEPEQMFCPLYQASKCIQKEEKCKTVSLALTSNEKFTEGMKKLDNIGGMAMLDKQCKEAKFESKVKQTEHVWLNEDCTLTGSGYSPMVGLALKALVAAAIFF